MQLAPLFFLNSHFNIRDNSVGVVTLVNPQETLIVCEALFQACGGWCRDMGFNPELWEYWEYIHFKISIHRK